jgi:hypothetical protein
VARGATTGWRLASDEAGDLVVAQGPDGCWLLGSIETVRAAVLADRGHDEAEAGSVDPAGFPGIRVVLVPAADFATAMATEFGDRSSEGPCLGRVLERTTAITLTVRFEGGLGASLVLARPSSEDASRGARCVSTLWSALKPRLLAEMDAADTTELQALPGLTPAALLDLVTVRTDAKSVALSLEVLQPLVRSRLLALDAQGRFGRMEGGVVGPGDRGVDVPQAEVVTGGGEHPPRALDARRHLDRHGVVGHSRTSSLRKFLQNGSGPPASERNCSSVTTFGETSAVHSNSMSISMRAKSSRAARRSPRTTTRKSWSDHGRSTPRAREPKSEILTMRSPKRSRTRLTKSCATASTGKV